MKTSRIEKSFWVLTSIGILATTFVSVLAGDTEGKKEKKVATPVPLVGQCLTSQAAIDDIQKAKLINDTKQKELVAKEEELKAKEQALNEEIKKLSEVRDSISKIQEGKAKEFQERVSKLVETFLSMSPKASAKLLATLNNDLAVASMIQMDNQKLAKIMNLMEPKRASELSELMVKGDESKISSQNPSKKGGEKNDRKYEILAGDTVLQRGKTESKGEGNPEGPKTN